MVSLAAKNNLDGSQSDYCGHRRCIGMFFFFFCFFSLPNSSCTWTSLIFLSAVLACTSPENLFTTTALRPPFHVHLVPLDRLTDVCMRVQHQCNILIKLGRVGWIVHCTVHVCIYKIQNCIDIITIMMIFVRERI